MTYSSLTVAFFPYAAIETIGRHHAHYLCRLSDQMAGFAQPVRRLGDKDAVICFKPSPVSRRKFPSLSTKITARLIRYQRPGFRASWLLTSLLDSATCTRTELIDLYHRRWGIETIYREWKYNLDLQNLRSHTPRGILKEVYAQLLLSNLVRWIMTEAAEGTDKHAVDLSFTTGLTLVRNAVGAMVRSKPQQWLAIYQRLLDDIRHAPIRKRPGRSYPRACERAVKCMGNGYYRLHARLPKLLT